MVTSNKELLMAFVYFDQSHCGYLLERDLEEILYTLGLHLSRAQVNQALVGVQCSVLASVFLSVGVLTFPDQEAVKQTSDQRILLLSKADGQREGRTCSVYE